MEILNYMKTFFFILLYAEVRCLFSEGFQM